MKVDVVLSDGDEVEGENVDAALDERLAVHRVRTLEQMAAVVRPQRLEEAARARIAQCEDLVEVGHAMQLEGLLNLESCRSRRAT